MGDDLAWDTGRSRIPECIALHVGCEYHELCLQEVVLQENCIPQTGVTFSYTINPFGPSAGRIFIKKLFTKMTVGQDRLLVAVRQHSLIL